MPQERIERLEALPKWEWDAKMAAWDEGFAALNLREGPLAIVPLGVQLVQHGLIAHECLD